LNAGLLEAETMRTFDALYLPHVHELSPRQIKRLRLREKVSQPVFAAFLNITPSTIKKWETGIVIYFK
jgi:putative transcriptional regulator